jgi:hypothetical protein
MINKLINELIFLRLKYKCTNNIQFSIYKDVIDNVNSF